MAKSILATKSKAFQNTIKTAPLLPGCYVYKNSQGKILYIGKAKVIRNRVKSYFSNYARVEEKIRQMIDQASSIEFMITDSEIEALILESVLIKKYKPKYNSMYVDDKSYAYVKFDKVTATKPGQTVPIPTITVVREKPTDKSSVYFGPYPDTRTVKRLLRRLRKLFPYCTSKNRVIIPKSPDKPFETKQKPCFQYQINLCNGACGGLATRREYEQNLNNIKKFFKGEKNDLQSEFEAKMKIAAKEQSYEEAARYRNLIQDIKYVGSNLHIDGDIDEVAVMKEKQEKRERAQLELVQRLEFPAARLSSHPGFKVECYDISNIQGTNAVGSMVVFVDGKAVPELYRRFKIKYTTGPNDFAMMQEMLARRFNQYLQSNQASSNLEQGHQFQLPSHLTSKLKTWVPDPSFSNLPDLIIIDGGKGQLSSTYKILSDFELEDKVAIVGLAKREEEIFKIAEQSPSPDNKFILSDNHSTPELESELQSGQLVNYPTVPDGRQAIQLTNFTKIHLPRRSEALYLVQRIRDEAHRFAVTYHRKLRSAEVRGGSH